MICFERVESPHGPCAIVELDEAQLDATGDALPEGERAALRALTGLRRRDFITGRTALHSVFPDAVAVLSDDRGAPALPPAWSGSISHKGPRAAAIAAPAGAGHVGIDLERAVAPRSDIGTRILSPRELRVTGAELTRVFAMKEAIYKAIDPIVRRFVGFTEVEIIDGVARPVDPDALPVTLELWCREHAGYWLATARARPR